MPPLPPNLTTRLWLHYTSLGFQHQMQVRFAGFVAAADLASMAAAIASAVRNVMVNTDSIYKAEYATPNTNIRFALPFTAVAGIQTVAGNLWAEDPESAMVSMTGKGTANGVRWALDFFTPYNGGGAAWPTKNRWSYADLPATYLFLFDGIQALADGTLGIGLTMVNAGSSNVVINQYLNISKNGYWERKQRRS